MRLLQSAILDHLRERKPILTHWLIWITARDRDTGANETIGLWTGADHETITVNGSNRTYYGMGSVLDLDPISSQANGKEVTWSFRVSSLHSQVIEAIRIYDARLAPIEVHSWDFNTETMTPIALPEREFRGHVMAANLPTPAKDQTATATISCVSDAWRLTKPLTLKRSDAALRSWAFADTFRKHNAASGSVQVAWGEKISPAMSESRRAIPYKAR